MAKVKIETSMGDIVVRLYDETPLHRDNFLKLAGKGFYDGTLFHRVIKNFMIQGGDPESIGAPQNQQLGTGGTGYTIPAEIKPGLIHKRGAFAAARLGDEMNPKRESSGCQFYIVWGEVYNQSKLGQLKKQLQMQEEQNVFNGLVQQHREEIMKLRKNRDREGLMPQLCRKSLVHGYVFGLSEDLEADAPCRNAELCHFFAQECVHYLRSADEVGGILR